MTGAAMAFVVALTIGMSMAVRADSSVLETFAEVESKNLVELRDQGLEELPEEPMEELDEPIDEELLEETDSDRTLFCK